MYMLWEKNLQGKNYVVGLSCETFVVYACIVMEVMYVYVRMPTIVTVCRQTLAVNIAKKVYPLKVPTM